MLRHLAGWNEKLQADKRVQIRRRIACVVDREPEAQKADVEKLESLQTKNAELREQVTSESHVSLSTFSPILLIFFNVTIHSLR